MKVSLKTKESAHKYVNILGIKVSSTPKSQLLTQIQEKISKKIQFYIVTPNPEIILQAQSDPELTHSLNSADFSLPDGTGLKIADKNLKTIKGREFFLDLLRLADNKKLKAYLLGGTKEVMTKSLDKIQKEYPSITVKGNAGPKLDFKAKPVSEVDTSLQFEIVKEINSFNPDLLFVAFGAPKQEIWTSKWLPKLKVSGVMVVGGTLDYFSGSVLSVPKAFENAGLEWLWRLIQEPSRIGRIFNALVVFPLRVILKVAPSGNQERSQG